MRLMIHSIKNSAYKPKALSTAQFKALNAICQLVFGAIDVVAKPSYYSTVVAPRHIPRKNS